MSTQPPQPFLPYGRQAISEDYIANVVEVLSSPFFDQCPEVQAFDQAEAG